MSAGRRPRQRATLRPRANPVPSSHDPSARRSRRRVVLHRNSSSDRNELPGYRTRPRTAASVPQRRAPVARGVRVRRPAVVPLPPGLQDQLQCPGHPQARRPARHRKRLRRPQEVPVSPPSASLPARNHSRCAFSHDLTESTRAMAKRGSDDLKKLATLQATLVRPTHHPPLHRTHDHPSSRGTRPHCRRPLTTSNFPLSPSSARSRSAQNGNAP